MAEQPGNGILLDEAYEMFHSPSVSGIQVRRRRRSSTRTASTTTIAAAPSVRQGPRQLERLPYRSVHKGAAVAS